MERFQISLLIGLGACIGSALRHSTMGKPPSLGRWSNLLPQLVVAACGAFLAGQFTERFIHVNSQDPWIILPNVTFLLAGLFGGYVTFPAFATQSAARTSGVAAAIRLLSSVVVVITFFCAGALLVL